MKFPRLPKARLLQALLWYALSCHGFAHPALAQAQDNSQGSPQAGKPYPEWAVVNPYNQKPATTAANADEQTPPEPLPWQDISPPPVPVEGVLYQSPPAIIHKEVLHLTTQQPEMVAATPKSVVPELTPTQLDELTPDSGENDADANAPLIQMPPPAAVQPLLPLPSVQAAPPTPASPPALAPDTASIDTLLKSISEPSESTTPLPPADTISVIKPAAKESAAAANQDNSEPLPSLSAQSKAIIKKIPSSLDRTKKAGKPIDIDHAKDVNDLGAAEPKIKTLKRDGMDISIQSKTPKVDASYQLEQAYNALTSGQTSEAVEIYKDILSGDSNNKGALFGLATTYHRAGQIDLALPLYARLLTIDPKNRDGLNNFLALLADEAPQESLAQMQALEARNPQFSPIPAQMAIIYEKLGQLDKANEKMFRAIELSPENLGYRYDMAIILDKEKKYDEAAKFYAEIVKAWQHGETIPGNIQKIQQRLTFISSNRL